MSLQADNATRLHILTTAGALALGAILWGCSPAEREADVYGNFEAIETTVSAQASGELIVFEIEEGDQLQAGQHVGQIDTVQLDLSRTAQLAQREAYAAQIVSVRAEVDVFVEQRRVAQIEKDRIDRLFASQAATQKQVDDIEGKISVLNRQIASTRSRIESLRSQIVAIDAQIAQITDQISKATIRNPIGGTVLTTFVEAHELVSMGAPLYMVADLDRLDLRAYVSGSQLSEVALGDLATVSFDVPDGGLESVDGRVTWISSVAEFTPRTVQTRDERTNLVYAIKIRVPNPDGKLKIGMPADAIFSDVGR